MDDISFYDIPMGFAVFSQPSIRPKKKLPRSSSYSHDVEVPKGKSFESNSPSSAASASQDPTSEIANPSSSYSPFRYSGFSSFFGWGGAKTEAGSPAPRVEKAKTSLSKSPGNKRRNSSPAVPAIRRKLKTSSASDLAWSWVFSNSDNSKFTPGVYGEAASTRYGPGRVLCRRWDGVTEVYLRFGVAYIHESNLTEICPFNPFPPRLLISELSSTYNDPEVEGHFQLPPPLLRGHRSLSVVTPYGPGEVRGGRANGIIKVELSFGTCFLDQTLVKFDVPQPRERDAAPYAVGNSKLAVTCRRPAGAAPAHAHMQQGKTKKKRRTREKRVRSLLNGVLQSRARRAKLDIEGKAVPVDTEAEGERGEETKVAGDYCGLDDSMQSVTKALTGESIEASIDKFLNEAQSLPISETVKSTLLERGRSLKRQAGKALANEDVYMSLSNTVSTLASLIQNLSDNVESLHTSVPTALDSIGTIIDQVSTNEAADATSLFIESQFSKSSPNLNSVAFEDDDSTSSSSASGRDCSSSSSNDDSKHKRVGSFRSLVSAEKTRPVIGKVFRKLKNNLQKQHKIIQRTARRIMGSDALKSVHGFIADPQVEATIKELTSKGISALTGFKASASGAGVVQLSDESIAQIHRDLLTAALRILRNANFGGSGREEGCNDDDGGGNADNDNVDDDRRNADRKERDSGDCDRIQGSGVSKDSKSTGSSGSSIKSHEQSGGILSPRKLEMLRKELIATIVSHCEGTKKVGHSEEGEAVSAAAADASASTAALEVQCAELAGNNVELMVKRAISVLRDKKKYTRWVSSLVSTINNVVGSDSGESIMHAVKAGQLSAEAALVKMIGKLAFDFLGEYLPSIQFGPIEGISENKEWWYRITRLSLAGLRMRRESVSSHFVGQSVGVNIWDLDCDIKNLGWEFRQCRFPYVTAQGTASSIMKGGSFSLSLILNHPREEAKLDGGEEGEQPLFSLGDKKLLIQQLDLTVTAGGSFTSWMANTMAWMFADIIKEYIVYNIDYAIDKQIGKFVNKVNRTATPFKPLLLSVLKEDVEGREKRKASGCYNQCGGETEITRPSSNSNTRMISEDTEN
eukprot:CAMPEP_0197522224 /NCGR_PEP_ID=MMETSP1318-20131121/7401_1 /TAXON_ID=552666 /ORGANISM="Partenskyella glossopodia, Strain RCC365" /LENGTH=1086 /DNA_ID=CAMNT_0043074525 /DNA_START=219 /DNA_END=3479 /DNA_ORIENTATION=+